MAEGGPPEHVDLWVLRYDKIAEFDYEGDELLSEVVPSRRYLIAALPSRVDVVTCCLLCLCTFFGHSLC